MIWRKLDQQIKIAKICYHILKQKNMKYAQKLTLRPYLFKTEQKHSEAVRLREEWIISELLSNKSARVVFLFIVKFSEKNDH